MVQCCGSFSCPARRSRVPDLPMFVTAGFRQNPYAESFNGHLRRELLDMESFNTLHEAQPLVEDWRREYNHYRPHQSLNYQTPAENARRWRPETQPAPS